MDITEGLSVTDDELSALLLIFDQLPQATSRHSFLMKKVCEVNEDIYNYLSGLKAPAKGELRVKVSLYPEERKLLGRYCGSDYLVLSSLEAKIQNLMVASMSALDPRTVKVPPRLNTDMLANDEIFFKLPEPTIIALWTRAAIAGGDFVDYTGRVKLAPYLVASALLYGPRRGLLRV